METVREEGQSAEGPGLLEREGELEALASALGRGTDGEGEMLAIVGPAGIGKSSLLAWMREHARERGLRVLTASGSELERALPFGVCRQLFEPVVAGSDAGEREALLEGAAAIAGRLLLAAPGPGTLGDAGEGAPPESDQPPGPPGDRAAADAAFAPLHGLYWLAANLAQHTPLLITIDDGHWVDPPSLRVLNYFARRLDGLAVTIAVGARESEPLGEQDLLDSLLETSEVSVLRLDSLSETASSALIRRSLGSDPAREFVAACQRATHGNPFYLGELLRALRSTRVAPTAEATRRVAEIGPPAISREVLGRVAHLEPQCADLVRALAVLGGRVDLRDAAALAGLEESAAAAAVDTLSGAGVLAGGLPIAFTHPIMRAAVYEDIAPVERAASHRRAASLLADRSAGAAEVAAQLLRTEPGDDGWTRSRLREAAGLALVDGATQTAIECLRRALAEAPPRADRFELLLTLGSALADDGDAEGIERLRDASRDAPNPPARAQVAIPLASALVYLGRAEEAVEVLERTLAELDGAGGARPLATQLEALLYVMGITDLGARGRLRERLRGAAERLRSAPGDVPDPLLPPLAIELVFAGSTPADEVADLAERALRGGELLRGAPAYSPLPFVAAYALISAGRPGLAERTLDGAIERAMRHGAPGGFTVASAARSFARLRRGDLRGAESDAEACIRLGAMQRPEVFLPITLSTLASARLERGDLEGARGVLASPAVEALAPGGLLTQPLVESRARVRFAEGDAEGGLRELERCREWAREWGEGSGSWFVQWRSALALGELRRGERERATELAGEDVELARRFGAPRSLGRSLAALGLCEGGDRGIALLGDAVEALGRSEDRLEHARALVELGAARRRAGERTAAREPLAAGMRQARSCGATALAERAYEELRASGARPRKILYSGVEALTPSELRVARMATEGMTNREIAQTLFVTQKTVEVHLTHAYQKLDIGSRSELAAALEPAPPSRP